MLQAHPTNLQSRSLGTFLCKQPWTEKTERGDSLCPSDIKQDALVRFLNAQQAQANSKDPFDLISAIDANPGLAATAYRWARYDALRRELGRGKNRRSKSYFQQSGADAEHLEPEVMDLAQEDEFLLVEADSKTEIEHLWVDGVEGVPLTDLRQAIRTLITVQELKAAGVARVPDHLRKQLSRLRKRTGLPLSTQWL
jgi:hypothetical protein